MTLHVGLLDDYQDVALGLADWASLSDAQVERFVDHLADEDALAERLRPFEVLVAMRERTPFPASLLERLPNLRLLVTTGQRNAAIDIAAANAAGITVCGTAAHPNSWATAELAWGLILAVARSIPDEDARVRLGGWQHTLGVDLFGRTLGLLGLGRLGGRVAHYGQAFGMRVVAWSTNLTAERAAEVGAQRVSKEELLETADVVSIHLVLGARSRGLVGEAELRRMQPTAYLVNTSRGPIVDQAALLRALHEGWIAGAALDVYDEEPLPTNHPLRSAPRTVLTPHIGYVSREAYRGFYVEALEDIRAFLAGTPIRVL